MADRDLLNDATVAGDYNGIDFSEDTTDILVVLTGVTIEKSANREVWFDGELTYTITINNTEGEGPITGVVVTDELDTTMFAYVAGSVIVTIGGVALATTDYTAAYTAPTLTVTLDPTIPIPAGQIGTISFRGTKVPETP